MYFTLAIIVISFIVYLNYNFIIQKISNGLFQLCLEILRRKNSSLSSPSLSKTSSFSLSTAVVPYQINYNGKSLFVPKNKELLSKMSLYKVEVLLIDDTLLDITQEPGIPYLLSLKQFNGKKFIFTSLEEGTVVEKCELDKPPLYLSFLP